MSSCMVWNLGDLPPARGGPLAALRPGRWLPIVPPLVLHALASCVPLVVVALRLCYYRLPLCTQALAAHPNIDRHR
eukprot:16254-Lingulodinium_polyedra.AAC.1